MVQEVTLLSVYLTAGESTTQFVRSLPPVVIHIRRAGQRERADTLRHTRRFRVNCFCCCIYRSPPCTRIDFMLIPPIANPTPAALAHMYPSSPVSQTGI